MAVAATLPPPATGASRWRRVRPPALLAGGVLAASVLLHVRDPHQSGSWGLCPWLLLTGTACPGCGGLRAVHDLTHGNLVAAASSNLLFVGSLPVLVLWWGRWLSDRWTGLRRPTSSRRALLAGGLFLGLVVVFWVVRNLEVGAWLAP
jgi:Protein of unknown function (DUF2752)